MDEILVCVHTEQSGKSSSLRFSFIFNNKVLNVFFGFFNIRLGVLFTVFDAVGSCTRNNIICTTFLF